MSGPDHDRPRLRPDWYKDAIIYELHVRAFADSNGDGVGDFNGLTQRLDYLKDLGVTAIWLLPFYPSPLKDDGYDIGDYTDVHPSYGDLDDFRRFLREAHARDLQVITELVINHTSDQHPWFQRARRAPPGSPERDFYVWSDTPDKYKETRIIFKDFEASNWSWDPVAKQYFWHRFYNHQPDLNFDNPAVHEAVFQVLDFWLDMGVDGLRLDAVPYLYEREGTDCENLPETHRFLSKLRHHVDEKYGDRMLLAEANQWPEDSVAYFGGGTGDECHAAFHFPLMPRLFMAIRAEDRFPILDIIDQTPQIPETSQWLLFLRNHDELTLEMVTDEERDYMYRVYATDPRARINLGIRRRLGPLLGNDRRRVELMNALLFSLPGTPVLYYGDEIGMGDNIYLGDRDSVRTPMQWSPDRNAGFSRANPQRLYLPVIADPEYHPDAVNVETHNANRHSLLWWTRRIIGLRRRFQAFGRGGIRFLTPDNPKVLAFLREHEDQKILIVANLSRFAQCASLDLDGLEEHRPVELFGHSEFPAIRRDGYQVTLGPHGFYWFHLEPLKKSAEPRPDARVAPPAAVQTDWRELLDPRRRGRLEGELTARLRHKRWFRSKARHIQSTHIDEVIPLGGAPEDPVLVLLGVEYRDGEPERYVIPLAYVTYPSAADLLSDRPEDVVLRVGEDTAHAQEARRGGVVVEGFIPERVSRTVLDSILSNATFTGTEGTVIAQGSEHLLGLLEGEAPEPRTPKAEQTNTSIVFGDRLILKLFRRLDEGVNPDLEIGRHLTERAGFANTPRTLGWMTYRRQRGEEATLAILQEYVTNEGDAWRYTLDRLGQYYERVLSTDGVDENILDTPPIPLAARARATPPPDVVSHIGSYLESARLLGERTAQMHAALARSDAAPAFEPERFSPFTQRSLYQGMRSQNNAVFQTLGQRIDTLGPPVRALAEEVAHSEEQMHEVYRRVIEVPPDGVRIRVHGDYHLGQVLYTGRDFYIIDFEGEPQRPPSERRIKRSPLKDVAGMLRSFDYAAHVAWKDGVENGILPGDHHEELSRWARVWSYWVGAAFLGAYLDAPGTDRFLPKDPTTLAAFLDGHVLEKAVYELGYELNNRPEWARVPLEGILGIIRDATR